MPDSLYYEKFDDMRWDIDDFFENTRTINLDAGKYLFKNPRLYATA